MVVRFMRRPFLALLLLALWGCSSGSVPDFREPSVRDCSESFDWKSAVLTASFDNPEGVAECGFWLSSPDSAPQKVTSVLQDGTITYEWSGLSASTGYVWWVWYSNGLDVVEARSRSFTTDRQPYDENLWRFLLDNFDADGDNDLSPEEAGAVKTVELFDIPLGSLSGLERLSGLEELRLRRNGLESIDLSPFENLLFLHVWDQPQLKELNMDNRWLYATFLYLNSPYIKSLDYSRCPDLGMVGWEGESLESMDLSKASKLYSLRVGTSSLKELDLSASPIFEILVSRHNPSLETIWLRKGTVLSECEVEAHTQVRYK